MYLHDIMFQAQIENKKFLIMNKETGETGFWFSIKENISTKIFSVKDLTSIEWKIINEARER